MTKEQDWTRFCKLLELAGEVQAGSKRSEAAAALMFEMLKQYTFEQVNDAIMFHIKTNSFFPAPKDIISAIEGSADDRARLAWVNVNRARERFGTWDTVQFDDPRIHYAIKQLGGWIQISETPDEDWRFMEKQFITLYQQAERMGLSWDHPAVPAALEGYIWAENRGKYADKLADPNVFPPAKRLLPDGSVQEIKATEIQALPGRQEPLRLAEAAVQALSRKEGGR